MPKNTEFIKESGKYYPYTTNQKNEKIDYKKLYEETILKINDYKKLYEETIFKFDELEKKTQKMLEQMQNIDKALDKQQKRNKKYKHLFIQASDHFACAWDCFIEKQEKEEIF